MPFFSRHIGIDYSGAETAEASLKGIRVYAATPSSEPEEVLLHLAHESTSRAGHSRVGYSNNCPLESRPLLASTTHSHSQWPTSRGTGCRSTGLAS